MHQESSPAPVWQNPRANALLMAATLTVMANATISPALPGLERVFAEHPDVEILTRMLVPAPSITVVLFAPIAGFAADRIGRRWLLLAGIILFAVSGSAGLFLPGLEAIFASRLVLGISVAMIMTAQTALIGDYFSGKQRGDLMGLQISARNFGGLVFISLAGLLASTSARLPFAIYALAGLYLPFIWRVIVEPGRTERPGTPKEDLPGNGPASWKLFLALLLLLQMMTNMIFFVMPTQLPFFLDFLGYDGATMTGKALACLMLAGGGAALLYSRVTRYVGMAGVYTSGYLAMASGFMLFSLGGGSAMIYAGSALIGIGYAVVMPNFMSVMLSIVPARRRGIAGGLLTTSVFLGQICSPLASMPLINAQGYAVSYALIAGLPAAAAIVFVIGRGMPWSRSWLNPV